MAMGPITFDVVLFKDNADIKRSREAVLWLMEGLVKVNMGWIHKYPTPPLYKSGVYYVAEKPGNEVWQDIPHVLSTGFGDCEDLACYRIAELRVSGIKARPYIKWRKVGARYIYHALVWLPGNRIEDPSITLGMHGEMHDEPVFVEP